MTANEIAALLQQHLAHAQIEASGEGGHFKVQVISEAFLNQSLVKRHQAIYRVLQPHIDDGTIHALSIDARAPESD